MHPIGSIYMSLDATDPSLLFGGTWERIEGQFLLAASDEYEVGSTGGEATHKLTLAEMPSHSHAVSAGFAYAANNSGQYNVPNGTYYVFNRNVNTSSLGGNQPHNNMPPYLAVYIWKRTA